jgi:5-methyltetrahydropteroyltriglutamate--homocysteine methyltransferase
MADLFRYHIDHHASLVRPAELRQVRAQFEAGTADAADLREAEDVAILDALRMQRRRGMSAASDGQYRRDELASVVYDQVAGFDRAAPRRQQASSLLAGTGWGPAPAVAGTLEPKGRLAADEVTALMRATSAPALVALPAPGFLAQACFEPALSAYPDVESLGRDLAGIIGGEVAALAEDGVAYVQLANPAYTAVLSTDGRQRLRQAGLDPDAMLSAMTAADAEALGGFDAPDEFRVGLDLCAARDGLLAAGYDADALGRFLAWLPCERLCVEFPADPAARFPLAAVPPGKVVSLGVVDVTTSRPEDVDELLRRTDDAAAVLDVDDMAISTNAGFAPTADTARLTPEQQRAKLELVETLARYYWGNEI